MSRGFISSVALLVAISCGAAARAEDDVVSQYLVRLLSQHPAVRAKNFDQLAADRLVTAAWMQFLPTPSISADKGPVSTSSKGEESRRATTYRLNQPIWTGGRLTAGLDAARLRRELSTLDIQDVSQNLSLKFIGLYQSWWALDAKVRIQKRDLKRLESLREMMVRRVESGVSAEIDLDLASVRVVQQQADLAQSQRALTSVLGQIQELFGESVPLKAVDWRQAPRLGMTYEDLSGRVIVLSPALRKANVAERLAQVEVDQAKADASPTLSIRAERQNGFYAGSLPATKDGESRVYANLQFSLGAAGSVIPQIRAASARAQSATENIETAKRELLSQLKSDWEDYHSVGERLPRLQRAASSASSVVDSSMRLFSSGRRSWLDLINAVREHSQSELQLIDAQAALIGGNSKIRLMSGQLGVLAADASGVN